MTIETSNAYLDDDYLAKEGAEIAAGQYVLIAVSDSGSGMSHDVIEQAFEPFFTTKPKGIGTGLGLSMVYGFVKQSGGHVKIYSEVGHGTAVKMYFPRVIEPRESAPTPAAPAKIEAMPRGAGAGDRSAGRGRRNRQSLRDRGAAGSRLYRRVSIRWPTGTDADE